jgi:type II secretory pathway component GspD/PulD (secretin)
VAKREVSTTVTVPDGQMIVIAGLTREDKTKSVRKVPLLGSLPVVGMFFRYASEGTEKTNMLIFVTPRIVTRMADAEKVMKEWRRKTGLEQGAAGGGEGETSGPGKP